MVKGVDFADGEIRKILGNTLDVKIEQAVT